MRSKLKEIRNLVCNGNVYLRINTVYIKPEDFLFFEEENEDTAEIYGFMFSHCGVTPNCEVFVPVNSLQAKLLEVIEKQEFYRELEKVIEKNY
jgi:hypothetical protein